MDVMVHPRLVELLCSLICHDLVNPVGAINNGIELVDELGGDMVEDALGLMRSSAREAANKLQYFRAAFGPARGSSGEPISLQETRGRATDLFTGKKIALDWPEEATGALGGQGSKLVLNLILVAAETLAGSGTVAVEIGSGGIRVAGVGEKAALGDDLKSALDGSAAIEDLTPRTAQAYYTGLLAATDGTKVATAAEAGRVSFSCVVQKEG